MSIEFNHTIVWAHDSKESANFLCQILGLPAPAQWGPFQVVKTSNGVSVDYTDRSGAISAQHYAYLVSEPEFDEVLGRVKQRGLEFWADPARTKAGEINHRDGGAACILRIRMVISSRSSRALMAAAAGILKQQPQEADAGVFPSARQKATAVG
jgi:hypothetical protein